MEPVALCVQIVEQKDIVTLNNETKRSDSNAEKDSTSDTRKRKRGRPPKKSIQSEGNDTDQKEEIDATASRSTNRSTNPQNGKRNNINFNELFVSSDTSACNYKFLYSKKLITDDITPSNTSKKERHYSDVISNIQQEEIEESRRIQQERNQECEEQKQLEREFYYIDLFNSMIIPHLNC